MWDVGRQPENYWFLFVKCPSLSLRHTFRLGNSQDPLSAPSKFEKITDAWKISHARCMQDRFGSENRGRTLLRTSFCRWCNHRVERKAAQKVGKSRRGEEREPTNCEGANKRGNRTFGVVVVVEAQLRDDLLGGHCLFCVI